VAADKQRRVARHTGGGDIGYQDVILKVVNDKGDSAKQQFRIAAEK